MHTMSDERFYMLTLSAPVAPDAWVALVAADPSLEAVDHTTAVDPVSREVIRVPRPHSARWVTGPEDLRVVFVYGKRGRVSVGVHYADDGGMTSTALREPDPFVGLAVLVGAAAAADAEMLLVPGLQSRRVLCPEEIASHSDDRQTDFKARWRSRGTANKKKRRPGGSQGGV